MYRTRRRVDSQIGEGEPKFVFDGHLIMLLVTFFTIIT